MSGLPIEYGIPNLQSQPAPNTLYSASVNGMKTAANEPTENNANHESPDDLEKKRIEQDEWLTQLVSLQIGLLKRQMAHSQQGENENKEKGENNKTEISSADQKADINEKVIKSRKKRKGSKRHKTLALRSTEMEDTKANVDSAIDDNQEKKDAKDHKENEDSASDANVKLEVCTEDDSSCSSTASECSLGDLEEVDEIADGDQKIKISSDAKSEIYEYLARTRKSHGKEGYNLDSFDPTLKDFLAAQMINQLFSKQKATISSNTLPSSCNTSSMSPSSNHIVQSRAALIPLNNPRCREACHIQRRSVDVGLGISCGIDLSRVGHCNYISAKV